MSHEQQFNFSVEMTASQHIWIVSLHEACKILGKVSGTPIDDEFLTHARGILGEPASDVGELNFYRRSDRTYLSACGYGSVSYTADLLQAFLRHFQRSDIIRFGWSDNTGISSVAESGGGVAVVSRDMMLGESTAETCRRLEERLLALIAKE